MSRLGSLQILRALAALAIALLHLQGDAEKLAHAQAHGFTLRLNDHLGAGVDLFFVISGFVMVFASARLFGQPGAAGEFLHRRLARVVPLYWLTTSVFLLILLVLPSALSSGGVTVGEVAMSYLFIPYAANGTGLMQPVYKLGWTLNYEMAFYAIFALLLALPARRAVQALAVVFAALVTLGLVLEPAPGAIAFWTHPIILEFVFGAALGLAFLEGFRLTRTQSAALLLIGVAWLAASPYLGYTVYGAMRPLLWGVPAALILAGSVLVQQDRQPQRPGLFRGALETIGDASYAIYLVHPLVIRALRLVWDKTDLGAYLSPWVFVAIGMALLIPLSIVIYRVFERPMTQLATFSRWHQRKIIPHH